MLISNDTPPSVRGIWIAISFIQESIRIFMKSSNLLRQDYYISIFKTKN